MERSRLNDRPRDRSRNFERRRENIQSFQNRDASPMTPNMPPREPSNVAGMHGPGNQNPMRSSPGNYRLPNSNGRGLPSSPAPKGGGQGFQGGPAGWNIPGGPGHAVSAPVYQGGSPGYQGSNQGYPGSSSGYQRVNQGYPGNNSGYQGVNQGYPGNNSG
ncbi:Non-specific serine/threonine protein kinase protein [Dioscorea alata]|uniref:Non-specific serine/threonine protein kinase protein n=1 Tax=Dioscorea alata TaxID=55571 RepID=A0ACB7V9C9_DIOAL|nr:Non-specific serine/threonine protein kinase protein [Dioscorea alata]